MNEALHISGIGLASQQRALDVIANNIANLNTQGYKRANVSFSEVIAARQSGDLATARQERTTPGIGVEAITRLMFGQQGELVRTDNMMDVSIDGQGFIELLGPQGTAVLWRGGRLSIDEEGYLVAGNGMLLQPMINISSAVGQVQIREDGTVLAAEGASDAMTEIGQLRIVQPAQLEALERMEGGYYMLPDDIAITDLLPGEAGAGMFVQGAIEQSNVDLNQEMVQLMIIQRAYAANAQILQAADEVMALANNLRR